MDGHDNDANKNAQSNSMGTQGIFSTPDLTVNAENINQQSNAETRSRVASIFANTDAGKQAQRLDDAMATNDVAPTQITSEISVDDSARKRSKKPVIIMAIALLAVIVGFTAWVIVNNADWQSQTQEDLGVQQSKETFTQYATYLLFGKQENELSGTYSSDRFYTLDERMTDDDASDTYWNTLLSQLDLSIETLTSADTQDQFLLSYLETHRQNMLFLNAYRQLADPSDEYIVRHYIDGGSEAAVSAIREYFLALTKLDQRSSAELFYNYKIEQYTSFVEALQGYDAAGCLSASGLDEACIDSLNNQLDNPAVASLEASAEARLNAQSVIDDTLRTVESDCWRISAQFDRLIEQLTSSEEEHEEE